MKLLKLVVSIVISMFNIGLLFAQAAVPTSGGDATGTGGSVSYSFGQVLYTTNIGTNGSEAQGVQQPYDISTSFGDELTDITLEFSVYPNPTSDYLILKVENMEFSTLSYQLFDIQGKLIKNSSVTSNNTIVNMKDLPKSTYVLKIIDHQKLFKTFKIIKN